MKRFFWFSHLIFTGWGFGFLISLHLWILLRIHLLPGSFVRGGVIVFGLGLVPMWILTILIICLNRGAKRQNWVDAMIEQFSQPRLAKRIFMSCWFYLCAFGGLSIVLPDSWGGWVPYLRAAGIPCFFAAFYLAGLLCACANWQKINRTDPSTGSG